MAMPTAVMAVLVLSLLGLASTQLATHALEGSRQSRDRVAALHAAEAGVHFALERLGSPAGATWCGVSAGAATVLPAGGGAPGGQQYEVSVSDGSGVPGVCDPADPVRLVAATGWSPSAGAPGAVARRMEAQVRMVPFDATPAGGYGFTHALFSNSAADPLATGQGLNVLGDGGGNNADVYGNDDSMFSGSGRIHGDLVSPGEVVLGGGAHVHGDVWAGSDVVIEDAALVDGKVTSATGRITVQDTARIQGQARAARAVEVTGSGTVNGGTLPNSPSAPPPARALPDFTYTAADPAWPQPVVSHGSCAAFATYLTANQSDFRGTHRVAGSCVTDVSGGRTVTVTGDAAIVADGWITVRGTARFVGPGGADRELWLISLYGPAGDGKGVGFEDSAGVRGLPAFVFARNQVTMASPSALTGQVYAQRLSLPTAFQLTFQRMAPVGFTFPASGAAATTEGFHPQLVYLREASS